MKGNFLVMSEKTFAIITDIHSNASSLEIALSIINDRNDVDHIVCLGDCFALGPEPNKTLTLLQSIENGIFVRGNHDRYLLERLWEEEQPSLEGMDPYDPVCQAIVQNEKWTAEQLGNDGVEFVRKMKIAYREIVSTTLVEFTHAWYQRDDKPPSITEAMNWRNHVVDSHPDIEQLIFVHGHIHSPRDEKHENLRILCQGATGLSFDKDTRGSVAFLTINDSIRWEIVRYDYDIKNTLEKLAELQPPFYQNLINTVKYAEIRNNN